MLHPKIPISDEYYLQVMSFDNEPEPFYELVTQAVKEGYGTEANQELLEDYTTAILSDPTSNVIIQLFHNDTLVGYIVGCINYKPFFNFEKLAVEHGWYVQPDHRKYSMKLLEAFETWAELMGCKKMSVTHYGEDERLNKIYKRKKYKPLEVVYIKELN